jgi:hypothetical protein
MKKDINVSLGYVIRTSACLLVFLAVSAYLAHVCSVVADNYLLLAAVSGSKALISWSINLGIAVVLFVLAVGVVAALVRPMWVAMIGYAVGAALYPLIVGSSVITWVTALVFAGALILYLIATSRLFANQIEVSTHPLGEKKMMISLLLAILVSVSVAVGYISDSTARSYVIPPEGKTAISKYMVNTVQSLIDGQKATAKQKEDAIKEAQKAADDTVNKIEEQLKPAQKYVPVMLGAIVFSLAQIVLIFVVIIAALLVPLLFLILKAARFIHTVTEKCQVVRWTLE